MTDLFKALGQLSSWVQIAVLGVVFYFILNFIRGTRGANILKGIVALFVIAFLLVMYIADLLEMEEIKTMLTWALNGFALALIIIFAPELRRGLSHLAQSPLLSPLLRGQTLTVVDELVTAAIRLSKNRIGALVAIERDVGLGDYVERGVRVDAALTSELLETIFYPGSALHDGAVILQRDRVAAAGCLFPLTDDITISKSMGTRHRAGLGVTEETDAVALIISEETGRISIAVNGKLTPDLNREGLEKTLNELLYIRRDKAEAEQQKRKKTEAAGIPAAEAPAPVPNGPRTGGDAVPPAAEAPLAPAVGNGPVTGGEKPPEPKKPTEGKGGDKKRPEGGGEGKKPEGRKP